MRFRTAFLAITVAMASVSSAWAEPTFTARNVTSSADGAVFVHAVDLDGDGDVDIISASKNDDTIAWHENDGSGGLTEHVITATLDEVLTAYPADLDGDGDMDVVSASAYMGPAWDKKIVWYENDGGENFTERVITTSAAVKGSYVTHAVDLDTDGDMDLVCVSYYYNQIYWFENDGSESFTERAITTSASNGAYSLYPADVDGDGDMDLLTATYFNNKIAWFENDGSESFTEHAISTSVAGAQFVYAVDLDADGDVDALSVSRTDDEIVWHENDGSENFTEHVIPTSVDNPYSVYVADMDGDGDLDLLSASWSDDKIAWYENDGSESFTARNISTSADGAFSVSAADVDGDGHLDVLSASREDDTIAWYENDSTANAAPAFTGGTASFTIAENNASASFLVNASDPDGDALTYSISGGADQAKFDLNASTGVLTFKTAPDFEIPTDTDANNTYVVEVNATDGTAWDLQTITVNVTDVVEAPAGAPSFTTHTVSTSSDGPQSVYAADLDGDGDMDVLSASSTDDKIAWHQNDGSGNFTERIIVTNADGANSVYGVDLDADGDMDALSASKNDDEIAWYENDGSGNFTQHVIATNADGAYCVFAADLNGDGDMDVLSASGADNKIAWYKNDGNENFTAYSIATNAVDAAAVYAADLDGDGDMDVFSASKDDGKVAWYKNDGSGNFTAYTITTNADGARSVYTADLDADGDVDVISASFADDKVAWYENDGSENFTTHVITTSLDNATSIYPVDLDADGDMDLLTSSALDDKVCWYENDGSGNFTQRVIATNADAARLVFPSDLDGDGHLDVISANSNNDTIAWYENDSTANVAPAFASATSFTSLENNASASFLVIATDPDGDALTYSISGGADQAKFDLNASTGVLTFKTVPDFEAPDSAASNNTYVVEVNASDGTAWDLQTITATVTNANEAPTGIALGGALSGLAENVDTSSATKVGGVVITDPDTTNSSNLPPANSHLVPSEFATIQAAIDASSNGDEVFVSAGTYVENLNFNGKNISVIGQDRATTIIDGNQTGSVVVFQNGENASAVLSGFTITNANNAGIWVENESDPTLTNLNVQANVSSNAGGIHIRQSSSPTITNLTIRDNNTSGDGGGIHIREQSMPIISDVIIVNNRARFGGGIVFYLSDGSIQIHNVLISGNTTIYDGGGILLSQYPGGLGSVTLSHATITNNTVGSNGATNRHGDGIYVGVSDNSRAHPKHLTMQNTIMWNNGSEGIFIASSDDIVSVSYSDISGGLAGIVNDNNGTINWGTGNVDADPLFVDAGNGDFNLQGGSPAINAGDPTSPSDPDGSVTDLGARSSLLFSGTNVVSLTGPDAASFEVVGTELFLKAGVTLDYETKNSYVVTLTTGGVSVTHTLSVTGINEPPTFTSQPNWNVPEGQATVGELNATDPEDDNLAYSIAGGADQAKFDLNATTGVLTFKTVPDFENPTDADTNNTYAVEVNASDGTAWDLQTITVSVTDVAEPPAGAPSFTAHDVSASDDGARSVFATDVDGDGDMDVLSASAGDDKIAWHENDGSESFSEKVISTNADGANSVYGADVDGDGDMDVLSASWTDDTIAWYENDGDENFAEHTISTTADGAYAVYAADMDGDGDMDVLSASSVDHKIAWYENDGDENFTETIITNSATGATSVYATDLDDDGDMDVLSAAQGDNKIAWHENNGSESFTEHVISTAANGAHAVYAADMDGDGDLDVLSASTDNDKIAWYENDGSESFTERIISSSADGARSVFATDMDGDGDMDALSASYIDNKIAWYENNGSESFTEHAISTSVNYPYSVFAADVDGDGHMDALTATNGGNKIIWYENNSIVNVAPAFTGGTASFTIAENNASASFLVIATDPDGDALTYSISGGADQAKFDLNSSTGVLTFKTDPDFENPTDADTNNTYVVEVNASDGTAWNLQTITATVTNANDPVTGAVTITGTATEGQVLTADLSTLADPDGLGTITYQWHRDGVPIMYGGTLKDGVNGVDGLDGAWGIAFSSDGKHAYVTGGGDSAVSWYERNASTGALTYVGMLKDGVGGVDGLNGAHGITFSSDGNHAYVTGPGDDAVGWYERNASTGTLTYGGVLKDGVGGVDGLDSAQSVTISTDGKHAYVTGDSDNAVSWYERNASTGALTYGGMLKDGVGGVDGLDGAWAVTLSSDGKHVYVTGEVDDAVSWFDRNASTGALTYGGMLKDGVNGVNGLDRTRGMTFSSDGKHAYVTGENDNAVSWYERNSTTGALTYGGMLKDGVNGVDGLSRAYGITFSSDGLHAYVTAKNDNAVSWYERNASTGALTYGGMLKDGVGGVDGLNAARGVTLSADGTHTYVVAQTGDSVSWFTRDPITGALSYAASDANYTLTQADVGAVITVTASYVDGGATAETVTSAGTAAVQATNHPPEITSASVASVPENQTFALDVNATDVDGDIPTYSLVPSSVATNGFQGFGYPGGVNGLPTPADSFITNLETLRALAPAGSAVVLGEPNDPASNGFQFSNANDFKNAGIGINQNNNFMDLWLADFNAPESGDYQFKVANVDDKIAIWLDLDQDGVFSTTGSDGNESLGVANWGTAFTSNAMALDAGQSYKIALAHIENGGGTGFQAWFQTPSLSMRVIKPLAPEQDGIFTTMVPSGSADADKFDLNATSGVITFKTAPDFEIPTDADTNNTYVVEVTATDGNASVNQTLTVTVTDVNEAPVVVNPLGDVTATEDDANLTIDLSNVFNDIDDDNASITKTVVSGGVSLVTASVSGNTLTLDFQGNQNGSTAIYVTATSNGQTVDDVFTVTVSAVNDTTTGAVTITGTATEGQTLTAANSLADPDGLGAITYQWYRDGAPIMYGGTLKDNVDGVDGLHAARSVTISPDGQHAYVAAISDNSVSWFTRDAATGILAYGGVLKDNVGGVDELGGANSVTISPDGQHAYVAASLDDAVVWFTRDAATGALAYGGVLKDNADGVDGLDEAYSVTISPDGQHVYVTGKADDAVAWFTRDATTGALSYGGFLKDEVGGINWLDGATSVTISPDGQHAYVTANYDHGVYWFTRDATTGALTVGGFLRDELDGVDELNGARNIGLSPDGANAYVAAKYDDSVSWFTRDANSGALTFGGFIKDEVDGVDELDYAHSVTVSSDEQHAYVSAIHDDAVSWFTRDSSTGALAYGGFLKDGVAGVDGLDGVQNIIISPDGQHAYAAAEQDSSVSWFTRDPVTGALSYAASDANYTLTQTDVGKVITVTASYVDGGTTTETVTSAATAAVQAATPPPITNSNFTAAINLWFSNEANATATYGHIRDWNVSDVTNMAEAFKDRTTFDENISGWDVSNVTNMHHMFYGASAFNQPVGDWNVSKVSDMSGMFNKASFFDQEIGDWNTRSIATMQSMFLGAAAFNRDVDDWDMSNVANMQNMFAFATSFNQDIGDWNTSAITRMDGMFWNATAFNQDISDWTISADLNMTDMFVNTPALSNANKGLIHTVFSTNSNWPYDWSAHVANPPPDDNGANPPVDGNNTQTDQNATEPDPGDPTPTLFRPLPRTLPHEELPNGNFRLWGQVLADGGSAVTQVAFELADNMVFRNSTLHTATMLAGSPNFFGELTLEPGKRYYYRAVATNAMGTTFGSPKKLTTPPSEARWWTNAPEISGGWRNSPWLGAFRPYDNGWIYHAKLGWAYAHPDGSGGLWLWFGDHHWMWTQSGVFPYLWKHDLGTWHYLLGTRNGQPVFYEWTESGNSNTFLFLP